MTAIMLLFIFVLGLLIGSFLNVCVSRIPEGLSIVRPRSRCPKCLTPIRSYDNIPVLSYLFLKGRCRHCGVSIPLRYPAVELLTAVITLLMAAKWRADMPWLLIAMSASYILITVSLIDFETFMIADVFSYALILLGFTACFFNPYFTGAAVARFLSSLTGAAVGAGIIWTLAWLGKKIYGKEAVGEGDIFLMGGIGALTGWQGAVSSLMLASLFGSVYGVSLMLSKRAGRLDPVPFGPFLSLGAVINLYQIIRITDFL